MKRMLRIQSSVFKLLDENKISKESLNDIFIGLSKGEHLHELAVRFTKLSDSELKKEIEKLKHQFKDMPADKLQGIIIGKLRGKAEPKKIIELLK